MSIKKLLLTLMLLVFTSTAWAMDDGLSGIESHIYKIKNKASESFLSSGASETNKNNIITEMDAQGEHTKYRIWYFEKAGEFYKIKSKASETCLSGAFETDKGRVFMVMEAQDGQENKRLWSLEKSGEFYKIKNNFSGTCLSNSFETDINIPFLTVDTQDDNASYRLWYFEKAEALGKDKNKSSGTCSDSCEPEKDNSRKNVQEEQAKNTMWYAGGCGPCVTPVSTYATGQEDVTETEIDRYTLFSTSFLSGAAYSLVPEIVRDLLVSRGYHGVSNAVATIVQGGMIVYYSPSYIAPITGMVVRIGCSQLGFSPQASATAGSTVAVVLSLSEKLVFSQETILDSVVDIAIGVAGSYAGSTLAFKAKSWVYGLWTRNNPMPMCEKSCQPRNKTC